MKNKSVTVKGTAAVPRFQFVETGLYRNIIMGGSMADNWVPLHSSQMQMTRAYGEQIKLGYRRMMSKLMNAVGETFVYTPN